MGTPITKYTGLIDDILKNGFNRQHIDEPAFKRPSNFLLEAIEAKEYLTKSEVKYLKNATTTGYAFYAAVHLINELAGRNVVKISNLSFAQMLEIAKMFQKCSSTINIQAYDVLGIIKETIQYYPTDREWTYSVIMMILSSISTVAKTLCTLQKTSRFM